MGLRGGLVAPFFRGANLTSSLQGRTVLNLLDPHKNIPFWHFDVRPSSPQRRSITQFRCSSIHTSEFATHPTLLGSLFSIFVDVCLEVHECTLTETRTINGTGNTTLDRGTANRPLMRVATPADHRGNLSGTFITERLARPNARKISNSIAKQTGPFPSQRSLTSYIWQWGQFLDHDINLTGTNAANGTTDIPIPITSLADPFDDSSIPFVRSNFSPNTGNPGTPRQQTNEIAAFIDASNVYGSDPNCVRTLRTNNGFGTTLATSAGNLLLFNLQGLPNAGGPNPNFFLVRDVRADEQVGPTTMHTLFVREHNRLVDEIEILFAAFSDEYL